MRNLILFTVLLFSGFVCAQTFDFSCVIDPIITHVDVDDRERSFYVRGEQGNQVVTASVTLIKYIEEGNSVPADDANLDNMNHFEHIALPDATIIPSGASDEAVELLRSPLPSGLETGDYYGVLAKVGEQSAFSGFVFYDCYTSDLPESITVSAQLNNNLLSASIDSAPLGTDVAFFLYSSGGNQLQTFGVNQGFSNYDISSLSAGDYIIRAIVTALDCDTKYVTDDLTFSIDTSGDLSGSEVTILTPTTYDWVYSVDQTSASTVIGGSEYKVQSTCSNSLGGCFFQVRKDGTTIYTSDNIHTDRSEAILAGRAYVELNY